MDSHIALLKALSPNQIVLEIDDRALAQATATAEKVMPNATARHLYIINSLCCNAVQSWLQDSITTEDEQIIAPEACSLQALWSVVTGVPLTVGSLQVVAIAEEAIDTASLTIPREWIDIPQWQPDYFIATQIDLDRQYILLWGYASLATAKQKGTLRTTHQYYLLERDDISLDMPSLGTIGIRPKPATDASTAPQAVGSETKLRLLNTLSEPSPFAPRLDIPFATWSTLAADNSWLQTLYERRCKKAGCQVSNPVTNLLTWLGSDLTAAIQTGWQDFSELIRSTSTDSSRVTFVSRSRDRELEGTRIEKAKLIDLQIQLERHVKVILLVAISETNIGSFGIVAQLHPESGIVHLPESVRLKLTADSEILEDLIARPQDRYLQIQFSCPAETNFELEVSLEGVSCVEKFVVARPDV